MNEVSHHVAWADRLGLNKIWFEDMKTCSAYFDTDYYPSAVERFENDIINIRGDGPKLRDKILEYKKNSLEAVVHQAKMNWIATHPMEAQNPSFLRDQESFLERKRAKYLHHFIIQLLEDNGFGFYESNIEEDQMQ